VARNLEVEPTLVMLEAHAKWRRETLPISLTSGIVAELKKGKAYHHGLDAAGRPLVVIRSRFFDPKERILDDALKAVIYQMDEAIKAMPAGQTQFTMFYDRHGGAPKNLDIGLMKAVIKVLGDNYPERLGGMYVYPAGAAAWLTWAVLKPFVNPRTGTKVHMITSAQRLFELIPSEHVTKEHGGNSTFEFNPLQYKVSPAEVATSVK
jgi:hypothetical protein